MLQIGKESREYNQLVGMGSEFSHLLKKLTDKINPWDNNKILQTVQRTEDRVKSPKIKLKSPPSLKYDPVATVDLAAIKEEVP